MKIIYFTNQKIKRLYPITLTRKPSAISCGGWSLEQLVDEVFKPHLSEYKKANFPCVWKLERETLWLNSRIVPWVVSLKKLKKDLKQGKREGKLPIFNYPWEVILENVRILKDNLEYKAKKFQKQTKDFYIGKNVQISQNVILDFEEGPIILDSSVEVNPFVVLKGPLYVGRKTQIKDFTTLSHSAIGKVCKLRGEIEDSVIEDYTNKQHYGFVGHSYIGSWVNLGAGTAISDLKNTYGEMKVDFGGRRIETGTQFLGAVIGDYVKTAINTNIGGGKLIGPNSFLYGSVFENVPAFVNYYQDKKVEFNLAEAYKVQRRMFTRRGVKATSAERGILKRAFELSRRERGEKSVEKGYFKLY